MCVVKICICQPCSLRSQRARSWIRGTRGTANEFEAPPAELGFADTLISAEFPDLKGSRARRNFEASVGFPGQEEKRGVEGSAGSPCPSGTSAGKAQPAVSRVCGARRVVEQTRWAARCWGSSVAALLHWRPGSSIPRLSWFVIVPRTRRGASSPASCRVLSQ